MTDGRAIRRPPRGASAAERPCIQRAPAVFAAAPLSVLPGRAGRRGVECRACPRLVAWREQVAVEKRAAYADQILGPPGAGVRPARRALLIVGLAPAAHGGNRTGRMFTGDRSRRRALRRAARGRASPTSRPRARRRRAGPARHPDHRAGAVRAAGQQADPGRAGHLRPWLGRELELLAPTLRAVVVLGGFGWQPLLPVLAGAGWTIRGRAGVRSRRTRGAGRRLGRGAGAAPARQLPRQPAEHLHRPADPGDAGGGAGRGGQARGLRAE